VSAFVALEEWSHAYGGATDAPAVEGLSIAIEQGEFAGGGRAFRLWQVHLDEARNGLAVSVQGLVAVAGQVVNKPVKIAGMAFQAPTLLPWRTTLENLFAAARNRRAASQRNPATARRICRAARKTC